MRGDCGMKPLRLVVNGSNGRMGQSVIACATRDSAVYVQAGVDKGDNLSTALEDCDAVIDFSEAASTAGVAGECAEREKILVIGTTGHTEEQALAIRNASQAIPIVFAPNFSVGVNALFWLAKRAAEILGEEFDLEIVEMHHRLKKDAPSGTAKRLAEILSEARSLDYARDARHGREGMVASTDGREIGDACVTRGRCSRRSYCHLRRRRRTRGTHA